MEGKYELDLGKENREMPKTDFAEYIVEKILKVIEDSSAEIFAHEWMNPKK